MFSSVLQICVFKGLLGGREINLVMASCSASKDDSVSIPEGSRVVEPSYYLDRVLVPGLLHIRERIFRDPRACIGARTTYAFDSYVRAGRAYKSLLEDNYDRLKAKLLSSGSIEWFFLSGGYGIVHALEEARKYQATFNQSIAYKNRIPYTVKLWKPILTSLCDNVIAKFRPDFLYVFGSRDYTEFIKQTSFWRTRDNVRIFESTGSSGPTWLSPILNELVESVLGGTIEAFNKHYKKFTKQQ